MSHNPPTCDCGLILCEHMASAIVANNPPTTDEARLAAGQLQGILSQLRREGLLASVALYESTLDVHSASDRRIIGSLYARMAREAMGS